MGPYEKKHKVLLAGRYVMKAELQWHREWARPVMGELYHRIEQRHTVCYPFSDF